MVAWQELRPPLRLIAARTTIRIERGALDRLAQARSETDLMQAFTTAVVLIERTHGGGGVTGVD